jgi:hypothetical protein
MRCIVWLAAAWALVLTASLTAFGAKRAGYARWGEVSLGFEQSSGLSLRYRGEPLVAKSSATFHDGKWQHVYYSFPHQLSEVVVDSTPQSRSLRVAGRQLSLEPLQSRNHPAHDHFASRTSATISSSVSSIFSDACGSNALEPSHVS